MFHALRRLLNRIKYRRFDQDIAEEMAFHREMKAKEMNRDVDRAMGNELRMREMAREVWVPPTIDALRQDLRDALRLIVRRPTFTAASVAALVVGVGAATIAFSLLNALVLRPLPVSNPETLVYLRDPSFSYPILREVRARSAFLSQAFGWNLTQYDALWGEEPEPTLVLLASGNLHATLGTRPSLGRALTVTDEGTSAADAQPVGVLSYGAWQRRFVGDPSVLGRVIRLQGLPITIVGVTPRGFFGVAPGRAPELTVPITLAPRLDPENVDVLNQEGRAWLHVMGRLDDGISLERADAEFQTIWPQVLEATANPKQAQDRRARYLSRRTALVAGSTGYSSVRNQFQQPLTILAGLAGLLLLVGCGTVANMLLAGACGRSRELAVRLALGCSRGRLARQLLTEGMVLATIAGLAAIAMASWSGEALVALLNTSSEPVQLDLGVDWRVVSFTAALTMITAVVFSIAPVLMAVGVSPGPTLKSDARQISSQGGRMGRVLVAAQIAFSVVLLVGAALFLRSLGHLLTLDPGFDGDRLLIVPLESAVAQRGPFANDQDRAASFEAFFREVMNRVERTPGVDSVSVSFYPPVSNEDGAWTQSVGVDGAAPSEEPVRTFFNAISPGFFATLGMRLVSGRDFDWSDADSTQRVVIINQTLAARFFLGERPLGRRITIGRDPSRQNLVIVGVTTDAKYQTLQEPTRNIAYLPYLQARQLVGGTQLFASVRVSRMSDRVAADVRGAIKAVDPRVATRVERLTDRIRESLVTERLLVVLAIALAASAVFLACTGLFGLMMHVVARRTREIGVRMALGAQTRDVLRQVLVQTLGLAAIGVTLGVAIALGGGGWIRSVLHGVTPNDPTAYVVVAVVTLALALAVGLIPARRAASVDPIDALRAE